MTTDSFTYAGLGPRSTPDGDRCCGLWCTGDEGGPCPYGLKMESRTLLNGNPAMARKPGRDVVDLALYDEDPEYRARIDARYNQDKPGNGASLTDTP